MLGIRDREKVSLSTVTLQKFKHLRTCPRPPRGKGTLSLRPFPGSSSTYVSLHWWGWKPSLLTDHRPVCGKSDPAEGNPLLSIIPLTRQGAVWGLTVLLRDGGSQEPRLSVGRIAAWEMNLSFLSTCFYLDVFYRLRKVVLCFGLAFLKCFLFRIIEL